MDIKTARLRIRDFTLNDIDLIYEINNHPECIQFNGWDSMSMDDCKNVLQRWILDSKRYLDYGIYCVENSKNEAVGMTFIMKYDNTNDYEIGFRLKRDAWNNGYGKELASQWIEYGSHRLYAKRICAEVNGENIRSLNIFRKLKFNEEAHPSGGNGKLFTLILK